MPTIRPGSLIPAWDPALSAICWSLWPHFFLSEFSTSCREEISSFGPAPIGRAPTALATCTVGGLGSKALFPLWAATSADPYPRSVAISLLMLGANCLTSIANVQTISNLFRTRSEISSLEVRAGSTLLSFWSGGSLSSSARAIQNSILSILKSSIHSLKGSSKTGSPRTFCRDLSISLEQTGAPWAARLISAEDLTCSVTRGRDLPLYEPLATDLMRFHWSIYIYPVNLASDLTTSNLNF